MKRQKIGAGDVLSALKRSVGLACYLSWVLLACFLPSSYQAAPGFDMAALVEAGLSMIGFLLVITYYAFYSKAKVVKGKLPCIIVSVVSCLCTVAMNFARSANDATQAMLGSAFGCIAGAGIAVLLIAWAVVYVGDKQESGVLVVAFAFFITGIVALVVIMLPKLVLDIVPVVIPLVMGFMQVAGEPESEVVPVEVLAPRPDDGKLPWRLIFGIIALGFVYGLSQDFATVYNDSPLALGAVSVAVFAIVGAGIMVYFVATGKNLGFSAFCTAIIPIAGFAQGMVATYQMEMIDASFFFMRLAWTLFLAMLWLQLPRVFARLHTLRTFFVAYLLFEGSIAAGLVGHKLLMLSSFDLFDYVALFALALLLTALTCTFSRDAMASAWELMPAKVEFTGKFRKACRLLEDEYGLTNRESEIMELVLRGRNGSYVQEKLVISKNTYQTHMRNMYKKLDVHSNQELMDLLERKLSDNRGPTRTSASINDIGPV